MYNVITRPNKSDLYLMSHRIIRFFSIPRLVTEITLYSNQVWLRSGRDVSERWRITRQIVSRRLCSIFTLSRARRALTSLISTIIMVHKPLLRCSALLRWSFSRCSLIAEERGKSLIRPGSAEFAPSLCGYTVYLMNIVEYQ